MPSVTFEHCLSRTPISPRVLLIALIASTAVVFDGYDLQALSYTLPQIVAEWHIDPVAAGLLASYTFVGLFVGAVGLGTLGDWWGRKRMLVVGVLIFALFMGTAGFAQNYTEFAVLRFIASIGMGGTLPGSITMLSEYVPLHRRGRMVAVAAGCFTFGFMVAAILAAAIVPHYGWRPMFHISYVAIVVAVLIALVVPETPQYLAIRRRYDKALAVVRKVYPTMLAAVDAADPVEFFSDHGSRDDKKQFRALWTREHRPATLTLSLLYLFLQFVVYALDFWMVTLLVRHGFSLVNSYSYAIEQAGAATLGGFALGWVLDRMNQHLALAIAFTAGGICLVIFGFATSLVALYVLNALAGAFIIGGQNVVHVLVMASYGTSARATGLGWALGIGRLGGLLGPLVGGFLLALSLPFPAYFVIFAIPAILCSITVAILHATGAHHRQRPTEAGTREGEPATPH